MKESLYIDSSFLVALLLNNHQFHVKAKRLFSDNYTSRLYISLLSIDESLYAFRKYRISRESTISLFEDISKTREVSICENHISDFSLSDYLECYFNTILKPRDALHLYYMRSCGIKRILTFDSDFINNDKQLSIEIIR